ncbi:uncharacterized protein F54H12.2-like [Cataglyphis hispanica]|uniref:uncharacterized protein F54H12.2-like n=1 Tax=Cataglyphis hispanica TaxID=1086592 RepID=UPI0021802B08|nr:uncharacterized protein F54H12.2-like [Cataglyphis hispanica]
MSFLHTHSSECLKSELDLFSLPPTQTSIESSQWIHYKPVTSLSDDSPIEFVIPGHGEEYLDLTHTMLSLRVRVETSGDSTGHVTGVGGSATTDNVGPVNHLLHSIFNQIDVYFNQKLVSPPNNAYAYRAYIEALLNYSSPAKTSHLTSCLWDADTPGRKDEPVESKTANSALVRRAHYIRGGRALDLIGHLHCDVFNQDKFLINGVEVRLRLVRSKYSFCLMDSNGTSSKIHILNASLLVRRAKISAGLLLAHARMLSKVTAKYPLTRVEVKTFTIHSGVVAESLDNVILGQLPKRIIVGIHFLNEENSISRDDYSKSYMLFAFDLTPDLSANYAGHWNLVKHGSLRLEVRFEKALTETVNCIIYAEFDNVIEIDSSRQVIVDFAG